MFCHPWVFSGLVSWNSLPFPYFRRNLSQSYDLFSFYLAFVSLVLYISLSFISSVFFCLLYSLHFPLSILSCVVLLFFFITSFSSSDFSSILIFSLSSVFLTLRFLYLFFGTFSSHLLLSCAFSALFYSSFSSSTSICFSIFLFVWFILLFLSILFSFFSRSHPQLSQFYTHRSFLSGLPVPSFNYWLPFFSSSLFLYCLFTP